MNKEELYCVFKNMFPAWSEEVTSYKKIGSKCLALQLNDGTSKVFLYVGPNNWQFGTQVWRKKPKRLEKGPKNKNMLKGMNAEIG